MKALIAVNVALFILTELPGGRALHGWLGLMPAATITQLRIWQPATYMFLHAGLFHLLFNMLALWMFGTELERLWGTALFPEVLLRHAGSAPASSRFCSRCCRSSSPTCSTARS